MHWTDRRERYRAVLAGEACLHPGSVFDPISARIAEELGFEVGMFAGSIASYTVLGAPDLIVLTLSEFAAQAYRINRAGKLPLMVDADHGYGNALNVMRTVQELETAGVAALTIEDTRLPRGYGETKPVLISLEEGVGKMRAALAAREDRVAVHHRPHQRAEPDRHGGRDRAGAGIRSSGRGRAVLCRRDDARATGRDCGCGAGAVAAGRRLGGAVGPRLSGEPARADRAAGASAVRGCGAGGVRDIEGAAGRHAAGEADGCGVGGADEAGAEGRGV